MAEPGKGPVSVVQVGIGGMGFHYLKTMMDEFPDEGLEVKAAVDLYPHKSSLVDELNRRNVPLFSTLEEVFLAGIEIELVVIASPLQYHVQQCLEAIDSRCCVLCEKPLAATIQDADRLIEALEFSTQWIEIGYQWSFTTAIRNLKQDILDGLFGRPIRARTLYLWPRDLAYYQRNNWAGRIKDKDNRWVLDSPANSAMAHDLHNLFFLLGERMESSAEPIEISAELYRAYPIENYDTLACRARTEENVELLFYASHATAEIMGPMFLLEFEKAVVSYGEGSKSITAAMLSGEKKKYGCPDEELPFKKLFEAVAAVRKPKSIYCSPKASRSQTLAVNGIQDSVESVVTFSDSQIRKDQERCWVSGLAESFYDCYQKGILPGEAGFPWARAGKKVHLVGYRYFPGGTYPDVETEIEP